MCGRAILNGNTMYVQDGLNGVDISALSRTPRSASWTMSRYIYVSYLVLDTSTYTIRLWKQEILLGFFPISLLVVIWKARKEMRGYCVLSLNWCVHSTRQSDRGEFDGGNWLWRLEFFGLFCHRIGFCWSYLFQNKIYCRWDAESVKVWHCINHKLYSGWNNSSLRLLSNGSYVGNYVGSSTPRLPNISINLNLVKTWAVQHVCRTPVRYFIHKHFYSAVSSYALYMCVWGQLATLWKLCLLFYREFIS